MILTRGALRERLSHFAMRATGVCVGSATHFTSQVMLVTMKGIGFVNFAQIFHVRLASGVDGVTAHLYVGVQGRRPEREASRGNRHNRLVQH